MAHLHFIGHDLGDWLDGEESMQFVHPNVPTATSEMLGVPTLMSRMLDVEELDISFGQADSLTHRLSVLLQEYTDGFAVPKVSTHSSVHFPLEGRACFTLCCQSVCLFITSHKILLIFMNF